VGPDLSQVDMEIKRNTRAAHDLIHIATPGLTLITSMQRGSRGKTFNTAAPDLEWRMRGYMFEEFNTLGVIGGKAANKGNFDVARGRRPQLFQKGRLEGE